MDEAGYEYVSIDACWMAYDRDATGNLQPDPIRFPSGIDALANYAHARGLKRGIYSSAGTFSQQGRPASSATKCKTPPASQRGVSTS